MSRRVVCFIAWSVAVVALVGCGGGATSTGPSAGEQGDPGAYLAPTEGETPEPQDGMEAAPEFRATRLGVQGVLESTPPIGTKINGLVDKLELAIADGDSAQADAQLSAIADLLASAEGSSVGPDVRAGLLSGLAKDLKSVKGRAGALKSSVKEHKNRCCGDDGTCSEEKPGVTCWELEIAGKTVACGGACGAPPPGPDTPPPPEEPPGDDDDSATFDGTPSSAGEDSEPAAGGTEAAPTEATTEAP